MIINTAWTIRFRLALGLLCHDDDDDDGCDVDDDYSINDETRDCGGRVTKWNGTFAKNDRGGR